ncbi:uncharacterized protein LOC121890086 [Thunnus maccoyii]|uniref:uncharacterized protein LOC121890086 n=1 Tax=Thunnus maccoyii TaxID=8240 RepID=UPI001C4BF0FC|nr:uncharacterized protein LOC121890086 [Thunnus maccoyii]
MRYTLICVLGLFLLNTLFYGHSEANKPKPTLKEDNTIIPVRGRVTLTCSVEGSAGWKYDWFRQTSDSSRVQPIRNVNPDGIISVDQGGIYYCRGGRGYPVFSTEDSNKVTIQQTVSNKAVVTLQPNWPQIYSGETITVRCEIKGGADTRWEYEWRTNNMDTPLKDHEYKISSASESNSGAYSCKGRKILYFSTEWSDAITLTVSPYKPKAKLSADNRDIPVGGSVTLTCSVDPSSSGWEYYWYKGKKTSEPLNTQDAVFQSNGQISVSRGGLYWCRGGRGDPVYYTEYSDSTRINKIVSNKAVVTLKPNWPVIYSGETITVRCEIRGGGHTRWEYEWRINNVAVSRKDKEFRVSSASISHTVDFMCMGRRDFFLTEWSEAITVTSLNKPKPTLTADKTIIPEHGSVTLTCSVDDSADWRYEWFGQTSGSSAYQPITNVKPVNKVSQGGIYYCRAGRRGRGGDPEIFTEYSNTVTIWKTVSNKAVVTLQPNWPLIYSGETITVRCEIQGGAATRWEYEWRENNVAISRKDKEFRISSASISHNVDFMCMGRKDFFLTEWSEAITLTSSNKPKPTLTVDKTIIPVHGNVTLTCSVDDSADWRYDWFRRASASSAAQPIRYAEPNRVSRVNQGGIYYCRAGRRGRGGDPEIFTEDSNAVTIQRTVSNKAVVTLQPNWPQIYSGETITVRCEIQEGADTRWEYEWRLNTLNTPPKHNEYRIHSATWSHSGEYRCKGRKYLYSSTEWSDAITLTVSSNRPKAKLSADNTDIPVGGSVTLTCSVDPSSSGWKYYWYKGKKTSEPLNTQDAVFQSTGQISVSQGGLYWCRGGRGDPVYYTEYSVSIMINTIVSNKAVVTLQPNWTEIYRGEAMMLRCEIHDGDTEWEYEWETPRIYIPPNQNEYKISKAYSHHSGNYRCKGRMKNAQRTSTEWSDYIKLTVSDNAPESVLTVSPSWLSPGDSVTLSCEVEHPSAGWRFYWYETVPKPSNNSYSYELLPGSTNGTEQDSYIIHGSTHTAGYMCRAGRGDPVFYTDYSKPAFVWSGDVHSAVTLKVSPDRAQHFIYDSVSVSCEGNFTEWRVRRFPEDHYWSYCSNWRSMTGSTCNINSSQQSDAVYWCESGSGEFSNAVNITIQNADIILVSPVHPVTEGDSVTLGCKLKTGELLSNVFFYQNDKLIQNDTRGELNISAVSKSDKGFYKCKNSGNESVQSWMSVKAVSRPDSSSSLIPLIVGLVCGSILIILLLLLYRYRRSKDSRFIRPIQSDSTNQDPTINHMVNLNETQHNVYSSPLHGDAPVYESIKGSEDTENGDASVYESIKDYEDPENDSHFIRPIQSDSTNQDPAVNHMVNLNETQHNVYSSLLHGDASVYESIRGSEDTEKDSGFIRPIQSDSTNQDPAVNHMVNLNETQHDLYSSLLHGDASVYESIRGSEDTENDSGFIRPIQSDSTNQDPAVNHMVNLNETQHDLYSSLLHGDASVYESIRGSEDTEKDSGFIRPIQSDSNNQDSAANHMVNLNETQHNVYSSLLHGDASVYESIRGSEDTENDSRFIRPIQSDSTNQDPAVNHMVNLNETQHNVYSSLLHGDASVYESIRGSEDTENDSRFIRPIQSDSTNQDLTINHMVNLNETQHNVYSSPLHGDASVYESIKGSEDTENGDASVYESIKDYEDPENDSHFIRPIQSDSTNQDSAANHMVNLNETQHNVYSSLLHGDACLYESVRGSEDPGNDAGESQDIIYSLIELKNIAKRGKRHETVESSVYADVKIGSAADDNLKYAQDNYHNKGKAKKHKGKSTPAATDEAVYSEV